MFEETCANSPCCSSYKGNYEEVKSFFASQNIPFEIISGKKAGSRIRSKLAVRGSNQKPLIGLFYPGSHEVFEIPSCMVQHEKINQAVALIKKWMVLHQIVPYQEKASSGDLRYIQCVVERASSKVQISFVLNNDSLPFRKALQEFISLCPPHFLHSIWLNFNTKASNTIFGPKWELIFGSKWLEEKIAGVSVCYLPGSFGQANLGSFEQLVESIKRNILPNQKIGEFYAGVGIIGLSLAETASQVILTEINPESKICFDEMFHRLHPDIAKKVSYKLTKADQALDILDEVDVAIVDPPRKGLGSAFINALAHSKAQTLVYVSCGWPSLIRDLGLLKEKDWVVTKAEGYPFFPGTPHLETLCFLSRNN
jgi:23S rRNA (uracil1939-C5)-methyltransferase